MHWNEEKKEKKVEEIWVQKPIKDEFFNVGITLTPIFTLYTLPMLTWLLYIDVFGRIFENKIE